MINNNTDLFKYLHLTEYNIDYSKSNVVYNSNEFIAHIYLKKELQNCLFCNSSKFHIHDTIIKNINHPIIYKTRTTIIFHQYKYKCNDCGKLFLQSNPIYHNMTCISYLGEMKILQELKYYRTTFKDVSNNFNVSKNSVIRCFDAHVNIDRHKLSNVICIDEKHSKKLSINDTYICVLFNPIRKEILDILPSRQKNYLIDYFSRIPISERLTVNFVNIDMWDTYKEVALMSFPNCTICVDSFHVIEHLNKAIDIIRINAQKRFKDDKDKNKASFYWLLKDFHYFFTSDFDSIKYKRHPRSHYSYLYDKHAVLNALLDIDEGLTAAYKLKEEYREFNKCATYEEALEQMDNYILKFKTFKYQCYRDFGDMIERWKWEIINSHIEVNGTRMSNGPIESLNKKLNIILSESFGFTVFTRFRNKTMYSININESILL